MATCSALVNASSASSDTTFGAHWGHLGRNWLIVFFHILEGVSSLTCCYLALNMGQSNSNPPRKMEK
jgi:hypothetical protein